MIAWGSTRTTAKRSLGSVFQTRKPRPSNQSRMRSRALAGRKPVPFRSIVGIEAGRQETLVGFLAVLVLLRRRVVDADQPEPFGEITLLPIEGATIDADLAGADLA